MSSGQRMGPSFLAYCFVSLWALLIQAFQGLERGDLELKNICSYLDFRVLKHIMKRVAIDSL